MKGKGQTSVFKFFLIYFLLSLLIFLLDKKNWLGFFHRLVDPPVLAAEERLYSLNFSTSQLLNFFEASKQKDRQIQRLQGQLRQLATDQNQLSSCLEENQEMKKLLGAPLSPKWKFLDAKVIGGTEKIRLNRGKVDGLKKGMMVITENILVGKVVSVGEHDSLVQLIGDPESKIPVVVKRPASPSASDRPSRDGSQDGPGSRGAQAQGLLAGQHGGRLLLDRVLQNEDIQKGDLVITRGDEDWEADLLVGQIQEVLPKSAEVYQKAIVSPLVDYGRLKTVFIVYGK